MFHELEYIKNFSNNQNNFLYKKQYIKKNHTFIFS